ncbi:MAG: S26 family signal peptidase [Brevundimonas sp.]|uniref:S26 family signal peptidase n=1 Tax=Brevundimonas sp. TaxID=1871086 RepID=UPI002583A27E|nr:S26 family signal peptidase [Brevundimonas sp.]MCV0415739.1 S26 family signal peptidase [Brevundimonas sp.]
MSRTHRLLLTVLAPVAALGALGAVAVQRPALALVNESPSLPEGLYVRAPAASPDRGAVVALPQPAIARPYLARLGLPAEVRLIKRVAATGGDLVCTDGRWLVVPGRVVPVRDRDGRGASLPAWRGCRRLASDERLLLGDTTTSFDSRYFGPVRTAQIEGVYRETLTW